MGLWAFFAPLRGAASVWKKVVHIGVQDSGVYIDVVWVKELWIFEWRKYRVWEGVREKWVFVWGLVSAHSGMDMFGLSEHVCEERRRLVWRRKQKAALSWREVHARVVRELNALNDVEYDCIFQTASGGSLVTSFIEIRERSDIKDWGLGIGG